MRRQLLVLVVALALPAAALASGPEGGGTLGTTLTVAPSDDLPTPTTVSVTGSGFNANDTVQVFQCSSDRLFCVAIGIASSDASGNFGPIPVTVTQIFTPPAQPSVDCGYEDCLVLARSTDKNAGHHILFAATCAGRPASIRGTSGSNRLTGTPRRDVILGGPGADTIKGLAGGDVLCGGDGTDKLEGGRGKDRLLGEAGKDRLIGGKARDMCVGGNAADSGKGCEKGKL